MYIILVYDIALDQNGAKVLRHVFKICKKYLSHVQKSVFEGELTKSQLKKLTIELRKWIRDDKDSVIIFKNRNKKWLDKQFLGMDMSDETSNFF
ncbi:CRISPR-associated endonuclease Cas2 [Ligilactobacillus agilis]|uniref:CRISPR-associated endoribonuclease Cas2 n=1 Tax=Ligilactobacillus agilis TaxID=1601 RepID=A0A231Q1A2_9LACO|nr:CRISPR-associated endonuclease Cas2 [Ligilactobacillus agilis]MBM6772284.1 CRISPR-associated endonuclease Cas2 [Ligilactobacillus agilis]MCL8205402.1 CRISPR-associated endonuclease Cas2 [Ligilactobacillus agilis]MDK6809582.1 CRISPR-associated endonuclease Cas2 [Ligilactobacillus agilis]NJE31668.1 CRISPR-associated endonuclease Cas2 [Ligilactobacillus agilis]NME42484.1 CRISPR-associated endonuclease Cas2 [Ligilactobacillus agilis]